MSEHPEPAPPEGDPSRLRQSFDEVVGSQLWEVDGEADLAVPPPEEQPEAAAETEEEIPEPEPEEAPESAPADEPPPPPERIVEALLFVGGTPLDPARVGEIVRGLTEEQFRELVTDLNRRYRRQNRPYTIREREDGFVLQVRPAFHAVRERFLGSPREARLNQAAIDVAALVAYRQPVAKSEIDAVRGTDSGGPVRQLLRLGLIAVSRRGEAKEREVFYGTTPRFLEVFGLKSLEDLPSIGEANELK